MKAPTGKLAFAYRTIAALEAERDTLEQRCRELEQCMSVNEAALLRLGYRNACDERDALRAEVERLTGCLKQANSQAEHFEREWYLRGDEIEQLERIARYLVRAYIVDDQAYNPDDATEKAMARLKEQIK